MNPEPRWQDEPVTSWLDAISLPALPWVKPFLQELGLPKSIAARPEVLVSIHDQTVEHYEALMRSLASTIPSEEQGAFLSQQVVTFAMKQLADTFDTDVSRDFENWARRNVVRRDWIIAFLGWRTALEWASRKDNPQARITPPPTCLDPLLPQITDLVSFQRRAAFQAKVERVAPAPTEEDISLGLDVSREAAAIEEIAFSEWTYEVLQIIAQSLDKEEHAAVLAWAKMVVSQAGLDATLLSEAQLIPCSNQDKG